MAVNSELLLILMWFLYLFPGGRLYTLKVGTELVTVDWRARVSWEWRVYSSRV